MSGNHIIPAILMGRRGIPVGKTGRKKQERNRRDIEDIEKIEEIEEGRKDGNQDRLFGCEV